jgi:hypothetical protein
MERHRRQRRVLDWSGRVVAAYGQFQPGDGTKYEFVAVAVPGEPGWWFVGSSLYSGYQFDLDSVEACYLRNRDAVGRTGHTPEYQSALEDHYVQYVASHILKGRRDDSGPARYTAFALVQWLVESTKKSPAGEAGQEES